MAKKSFLEKAVNRKIGGMKRSAKANLKKEAKDSSWFITFLAVVGWIVIIAVVIAVVTAE